MAKEINQHSYAARVLKDKGMKISAGGKQILTQEYPFVHEELITKIRLDDTALGLLQKFDKHINYPELLSLGFDIFARKPKSLRSPGQRVEYYISGINRLKKSCGRIPINHVILQDLKKGMLRINGSNADTSWVYLKTYRGSYKVKHSVEDTKHCVSKANEILRRLTPYLTQPLSVLKTIPELVFGVTDCGEYACIDHNVTDTPVIGIGGRRSVGKCLDGDTRIFCNNTIKKIKDVVVGDGVLSVNDLKTVRNKVIATEHTGMKELLRISLNKNTFVDCSPDHKFLTPLGIKTASDLKVNELLFCTKRLHSDKIVKEIDYTYCSKVQTNQWKNKYYSRIKQKIKIPLTYDYGFICGMYLSEGAAGVSISVADERLKDFFVRVCQKVNISTSQLRNRDQIKGVRLIGNAAFSHFLIDYFGTGSGKKDIPTFVFDSPLEFKKGILAGYFSGDGEYGNNVAFTSKSKCLADKISILLKFFGIQTSYYVKINKRYGHFYKYILRNCDVKKFKDTIIIPHPKFDKINSDGRVCCKDVINIDYQKLLAMRRMHNLSKRRTKTRRLFDMLGKGRRKGNYIGRVVLNNLLEQLKDEKPEIQNHPYFLELMKYLNADVSFTPITSIEKIGLRDTYDIQIENDSNFMLANGIITHNSILKQAIIDSAYHKFKAACFELNDVNLETQSYALTWKDKDSFFLRLLQYIGAPSIPLPVVYLSPSMRNFRSATLFYPEEVSFKISLPFKEVVVNYNQFFRGDKHLELGKSAKFMDEILYDNNGNFRTPNLCSAKNLVDAQNIISECLPTHRFGKSIKGVQSKILSTLRWQWNLQYFDTSSGVDSTWIVEFSDGSKKEYYPWNAILVAGLFGSLITSALRDEKYHAPYVSFVTNSVFDMMKNDLIMKGREVWLSCDEFSDMMKDKKTMQLFEEVVREGRMNRIGFVWVTQHLKDVPESIRRTNTSYTFAFRMDASTARQVGKDHGLEADDSRVKDLHTGLKKFQCIAFTKEDKGFVLYDARTGARRVSVEPVKIVQIFPSISRHMPPKEPAGEELRGEVA